MSRYDSGGWRPYVPVAQRRAEAWQEMEKLRQRGEDIQLVKIQGRTIARSFWGKGWCEHLESFGDLSNRLPRGRTYVRNGSVCHLAIKNGVVDALVSGSELYEVKVQIDPLKKPKWNKLKQKCTGKIGSLIELLQGRLSEEILAIVVDRQKGLFPLRGEIHYDCNCPDWAGMCKHIAAVMYGVGARLDDRPELLFTLRGVDHQELISTNTSLDTIANGGGSTRSRRRSLAGQDLENIFGVELEPSAADVTRNRRNPRGTTDQSGKKRAKKRTVRRSKPTAAAATAPPQAESKAVKAKNHRSANEETGKRRPFIPSAQSVAALRRQLGMNKSEFARAIGVSPPTITNWESSRGPLVLHEKSLAGLRKLHGG